MSWHGKDELAPAMTYEEQTLTVLGHPIVRGVEHLGLERIPQSGEGCHNSRQGPPPFAPGSPYTFSNTKTFG